MKKQEVVEIKRVELETFPLTIVGDTPLIVHAWSTKAKRMMLEAQQGKKKGKAKEYKNPVNDFIDSMYWLTEKPDTDALANEEESEKAYIHAIENGARFGFPIVGVKQAACSAAYRMGWAKSKMELRGAFFLNPSGGGQCEFLEIESDPPVIREDMVRIGMGTADIRYRAEFRNWRANLLVTINRNGQFSTESIISVIEAGGLLCGIGEWRPEKDGNFGKFHVEVK